MADQRFIQYGDRKMPLEAGVTLEQAKELMARYFPELADPKVETKNQREGTVYVFSKKAGHKGAATLLAQVAQKLARARETEIVPGPARQAVADDPRLLERDDDPWRDPYEEDPLAAIARGLRDDAAAVRSAASGLLDLPAAQVPTGSVL